MGEPAEVLEFKKKPSFADALKKTAKKKVPAKKKTTIPILDAPENVQEAVDDYLAAAKAEKEAKAEMGAAKDVIVDFVQPVQDEDGCKGKFRTSYTVKGKKKGNKAKFISSNRWTINADDVEDLQELLGEHFEEMIDQQFKVNLKSEVFENQGLQDELMELVGDRFADFFDTITDVKVKEGFDKMLYKAVDDLDELRALARQYSPSVRG